jgi:hypothetical protein
MVKKNLIPVLYCVVFPFVIGYVLLILPWFYSLVDQETTVFSRVVRVLITIWLMLVYASCGIPFISSQESSSVRFLTNWRKDFYLLNEKNEPRMARSLFPAYFFLSRVFICVLVGIIFLAAISTFTELTMSEKMSIAAINFILLFIPNVALYNQVLTAVYGSEQL